MKIASKLALEFAFFAKFWISIFSLVTYCVLVTLKWDFRLFNRNLLSIELGPVASLTEDSLGRVRLIFSKFPREHSF